VSWPCHRLEGHVHALEDLHTGVAEAALGRVLRSRVPPRTAPSVQALPGPGDVSFPSSLAVKSASLFPFQDPASSLVLAAIQC